MDRSKLPLFRKKLAKVGLTMKTSSGAKAKGVNIGVDIPRPVQLNRDGGRGTSSPAPSEGRDSPCREQSPVIVTTKARRVMNGESRDNSPALVNPSEQPYDPWEARIIPGREGPSYSHIHSDVHNMDYVGTVVTRTSTLERRTASDHKAQVTANDCVSTPHRAHLSTFKGGTSNNKPDRALRSGELTSSGSSPRYCARDGSQTLPSTTAALQHHHSSSTRSLSSSSSGDGQHTLTRGSHAPRGVSTSISHPHLSSHTLHAAPSLDGDVPPPSATSQQDIHSQMQDNYILSLQISEDRIRGRSNSSPTISVSGLTQPCHLAAQSPGLITHQGRTNWPNHTGALQSMEYMARNTDEVGQDNGAVSRLETSHSHGHLAGVTHMATIMERSGDWDSLEEIYANQGPLSPGSMGTSSLRRSTFTSPSCGVRMAEIRAKTRSQEGYKSGTPSPEPHSPSPQRHSPSPAHSPLPAPQRYSPSFGFSPWGLETAGRLQRPIHTILEEERDAMNEALAAKTAALVKHARSPLKHSQHTQDKLTGADDPQTTSSLKGRSTVSDNTGTSENTWGRSATRPFLHSPNAPVNSEGDYGLKTSNVCSIKELQIIPDQTVSGSNTGVPDVYAASEEDNDLYSKLPLTSDPRGHDLDPDSPLHNLSDDNLTTTSNSDTSPYYFVYDRADSATDPRGQGPSGHGSNGAPMVTDRLSGKHNKSSVRSQEARLQAPSTKHISHGFTQVQLQPHTKKVLSQQSQGSVDGSTNQLSPPGGEEDTSSAYQRILSPQSSQGDISKAAPENGTLKSNMARPKGAKSSVMNIQRVENFGHDTAVDRDTEARTPGTIPRNEGYQPHPSYINNMLGADAMTASTPSESEDGIYEKLKPSWGCKSTPLATSDETEEDIYTPLSGIREQRDKLLNMQGRGAQGARPQGAPRAARSKQIPLLHTASGTGPDPQNSSSLSSSLNSSLTSVASASSESEASTPLMVRRPLRKPKFTKARPSSNTAKDSRMASGDSKSRPITQAKKGLNGGEGVQSNVTQELAKPKRRHLPQPPSESANSSQNRKPLPAPLDIKGYGTKPSRLGNRLPQKDGVRGQGQGGAEQTSHGVSDNGGVKQKGSVESRSYGQPPQSPKRKSSAGSLKDVKVKTQGVKKGNEAVTSVRDADSSIKGDSQAQQQTAYNAALKGQNACNAQARPTKLKLPLSSQATNPEIKTSKVKVMGGAKNSADAAKSLNSSGNREECAGSRRDSAPDASESDTLSRRSEVGSTKRDASTNTKSVLQILRQRGLIGPRGDKVSDQGNENGVLQRRSGDYTSATVQQVISYTRRASLGESCLKSQEVSKSNKTMTQERPDKLDVTQRASFKKTAAGVKVGQVCEAKTSDASSGFEQLDNTAADSREQGDQARRSSMQTSTQEPAREHIRRQQRGGSSPDGHHHSQIKPILESAANGHNHPGTSTDDNEIEAGCRGNQYGNSGVGADNACGETKESLARHSPRSPDSQLSHKDTSTCMASDGPSTDNVSPSDSSLPDSSPTAHCHKNMDKQDEKAGRSIVQPRLVKPYASLSRGQSAFTSKFSMGPLSYYNKVRASFNSPTQHQTSVCSTYKSPPGQDIALSPPSPFKESANENEPLSCKATENDNHKQKPVAVSKETQQDGGQSAQCIYRLNDSRSDSNDGDCKTSSKTPQQQCCGDDASVCCETGALHQGGDIIKLGEEVSEVGSETGDGRECGGVLHSTDPQVASNMSGGGTDCSSGPDHSASAAGNSCSNGTMTDTPLKADSRECKDVLDGAGYDQENMEELIEGCKSGGKCSSEQEQSQSNKTTPEDDEASCLMENAGRLEDSESGSGPDGAEAVIDRGCSEEGSSQHPAWQQHASPTSTHVAPDDTLTPAPSKIPDSSPASNVLCTPLNTLPVTPSQIDGLTQRGDNKASSVANHRVSSTELNGTEVGCLDGDHKVWPSGSACLDEGCVKDDLTRAGTTDIAANSASVNSGERQNQSGAIQGHPSSSSSSKPVGCEAQDPLSSQPPSDWQQDKEIAAHQHNAIAPPQPDKDHQNAVMPDPETGSGAGASDSPMMAQCDDVHLAQSLCPSPTGLAPDAAHRTIHVATCYHSSLSRNPKQPYPGCYITPHSQETIRSHSENDCTVVNCHVLYPSISKTACRKPLPVFSRQALTATDSLHTVTDIIPGLSVSEANLQHKCRVVARDTIADLGEIIQAGHEPWVIYHHHRDSLSGPGNFSVIGNLRLSESGYDSWKSQDSGSTLAHHDSQDESESSGKNDLEYEVFAADGSASSSLNDLDTLGSTNTVHCLQKQWSVKLSGRDVDATSTHLGDSKWSSDDTLFANDMERSVYECGGSEGRCAAHKDHTETVVNEGAEDLSSSVPLGLESVLCGSYPSSPKEKHSALSLSCKSDPSCNKLPEQCNAMAPQLIPRVGGSADKVFVKTDSDETIKGEETGGEELREDGVEAGQPGAGQTGTGSSRITHVEPTTGANTGETDGGPAGLARAFLSLCEPQAGTSHHHLTLVTQDPLPDSTEIGSNVPLPSKGELGKDTRPDLQALSQQAITSQGQYSVPTSTQEEFADVSHCYVGIYSITNGASKALNEKPADPSSLPTPITDSPKHISRQQQEQNPLLINSLGTESAEASVHTCTGVNEAAATQSADSAKSGATVQGGLLAGSVVMEGRPVIGRDQNEPLPRQPDSPTGSSSDSEGAMGAETTNSLLTCSSHTYESIEDSNMSASTHSYESIEDPADFINKLRASCGKGGSPPLQPNSILPVLHVNDMPLYLKPDCPPYEKSSSAPDIQQTKYTAMFITGEASLKRTEGVLTLNKEKEHVVGHEDCKKIKETAVSETSLHGDFSVEEVPPVSDGNYVSIEHTPSVYNDPLKDTTCPTKMSESGKQIERGLVSERVYTCVQPEGAGDEGAEKDSATKLSSAKMRLPQFTKRLRMKWHGKDSSQGPECEPHIGTAVRSKDVGSPETDDPKIAVNRPAAGADVQLATHKSDNAARPSKISSIIQELAKHSSDPEGSNAKSSIQKPSRGIPSLKSSKSKKLPATKEISTPADSDEMHKTADSACSGAPDQTERAPVSHRRSWYLGKGSKVLQSAKDSSKIKDGSDHSKPAPLKRQSFPPSKASQPELSPPCSQSALPTPKSSFFSKTSPPQHNSHHDTSPVNIGLKNKNFIAKHLKNEQSSAKSKSSSTTSSSSASMPVKQAESGQPKANSGRPSSGSRLPKHRGSIGSGRKWPSTSNSSQH